MSASSATVQGFKFASRSAGIKKSGKFDLAMIYSEKPARCAGVFTTNKVVAPPVVVSSGRIARGLCQAVVVNSGNANACTGPQGWDDCRTLATRLATELAIDPREILIASTGVIGVPLPVQTLVAGLPQAVRSLSARGWNDAADALLTTDLVRKTSRTTFRLGRSSVAVGGLAKGSGMIHPNMATMLAFLHTDAVVGQKTLARALREAVDVSFNSITIDGDTSTNDCVFVLANGRAGHRPIRAGSREYRALTQALTEVSRDLAIQIVRDGEGATKFVTLRVEGAKTRAQAHRVATSVATSSLVKTALFGEDPNWGRILAAAGYAGVPLRPEGITIRLNNAVLYRDGRPNRRVSPQALRKKMKNPNIRIDIDLNAGRQAAEVYTCDLSYDYVRINAEYTT